MGAEKGSLTMDVPRNFARKSKKGKREEKEREFKSKKREMIED
jgi:hypothetical protein